MNRNYFEGKKFIIRLVDLDTDATEPFFTKMKCRKISEIKGIITVGSDYFSLCQNYIDGANQDGVKGGYNFTWNKSDENFFQWIKKKYIRIEDREEKLKRILGNETN